MRGLIIEPETAMGPGGRGQEPELFIEVKRSDRLAAPSGEIADLPKLSGRGFHRPSIVHEPHHTRTYRYDSMEIARIQRGNGSEGFGTR